MEWKCVLMCGAQRVMLRCVCVVWVTVRVVRCHTTIWHDRWATTWSVKPTLCHSSTGGTMTTAVQPSPLGPSATYRLVWGPLVQLLACRLPPPILVRLLSAMCRASACTFRARRRLTHMLVETCERMLLPPMVVRYCALVTLVIAKVGDCVVKCVTASLFDLPPRHTHAHTHRATPSAPVFVFVLALVIVLGQASV